MAHVACALRRKLGETPFALGNRVLDHPGDEAPDGFVEKPRAVNAGIGVAHLRERFGGDRHLGELGEIEQPGTEAVIDVVIVVGDVVGESSGLRLDRGEGGKLEVLLRAIGQDRVRHGRPIVPRRVRSGQRAVMLHQPFERLPGEIDPVEARIFLFQLGDDAQRLRIVVEAAGALHGGVERALAGVAERRMAEIMRERERLGQILVDAKGSGERAGDLRDFEAVGQPRAVMIAFVIDEDLGLVVQPAEGGRMQDAVAVARVRRARVRRRLGR